jgi:hypothetical protein
VGYFVTLYLDYAASNGDMRDELKGFGRKQSCPEQGTIQHLPGGNEECHGNFQHNIDSTKDYKSSYRQFRR